MTTSYAAPLGIAARPFEAGGTFPGVPLFGTPSAVGGFPGMSFPVSNGSQPGGSGIGGFAPSTFRENRVVDWPTNGQVAYHYVVTPDKNNEFSGHRLASVGIGMLCFARDMSLQLFNETAERFPKPNYGPGQRTERTVEIFELTALNEYLRREDRGRCISSILTSAKQVAEAFPMVGVVLTEVAPSNDSNYGSRPSTRVINFTVRGRCQTFNLWSGKRPAGTPVWFIIKKMRYDGRMVWAYQPYPSAEQPTLPTRGVDYHSPRPPLEDMCWEENGVTHVGEAVYVGMLGHNAGDVSLDPHKEMWKQGLFKTGDKCMPPTTEIFVRV